MRINDVLETNDQIDEGIASTIGQGLGAVGRGIGAVASVPQGIGRAVKRGYQAGLDTISGDAPGTAAAQSAGGSAPVSSAGGGASPDYQKGYQDGMAAAGQGGGNSFTKGFKQGFTGSAGSTQSTAPAANAAPNTGGAGTTQPAAPAAPVSAVNDEKFMASLQSLKGADIENIRSLLKARAGSRTNEDLDEGWRDTLSAAGQSVKQGLGTVGSGIAHGANVAAHTIGSAGKVAAQNAAAGAKWAGGKAVQGAKWAGGKAVQGAKIAGGAALKGAQAAGQAIANAPDTLGTVAGKIGASGTSFRQAYQNARGGSMTTQEIQRSIAKMSPQDARNVLRIFNSLYPAAAAQGQTAPATGTPNLQVQQGGRAPAPEADPMATGTNESYSRYLGIML